MAHWIVDMQVFDGFDFKCSNCKKTVFLSTESSIKHIGKKPFEIFPVCPWCKEKMEKSH